MRGKRDEYELGLGRKEKKLELWGGETVEFVGVRIGCMGKCDKEKRKEMSPRSMERMSKGN